MLAFLSRHKALAQTFAPITLLILIALGIAIRSAIRISHSASSITGTPAPTRPAPEYRERLDGVTYINEDAGFVLRAPEGWKAELGSRERDRLSYEGLILKATKGSASGPMISLVRRALKPGQSTDPIGYTHTVLLGGGTKQLLYGPALLEIEGKRAAHVRYSLPSGKSAMLIEQYVVIQGTDVYTFTGVTPEGSDVCATELAGVVRSFRRNT